jgi:hypothetical protein
MSASSTWTCRTSRRCYARRAMSQVLAFFNNHGRGQAVKNAELFEQLIEERIPGALRRAEHPEMSPLTFVTALHRCLRRSTSQRVRSLALATVDIGSKNFLRLLCRIDDETPKHVAVRLVLDNYGTHRRRPYNGGSLRIHDSNFISRPRAQVGSTALNASSPESLAEVSAVERSRALSLSNVRFQNILRSTTSTQSRLFGRQQLT